MFQYIWPVILVVFSNTVYQVCTKNHYIFTKNY